jgi:Putative capsular polysaccharide synthesis protein
MPQIKQIIRFLIGRFHFFSWLYAAILLHLRHFKVSQGKIPLIVFTMGKTGTRSLYCSLDQAIRSRPIYYLHCISEEGAEMANRLSATVSSPAPVFNYWAASYLRNRYAEAGIDRWDIITSVRDPVAVNLSAFFQTIEHWVPNFMVRYESDEITLNGLITLFIENFPHDYPLSWFDDEVLPFFGIDVYAHPFSRDRGYEVIEGERARLLVFRLDKLDDCYAEAIGVFLDLHDFVLERHNSADDKDYGDIYRAFFQQIRLPALYLDKIYGSKLVRHFYSDSEIVRFRNRWEPERDE